MKWLLSIFIILNSLLYSQGIYFSEPTSSHTDYIWATGQGPIDYSSYHANDLILYHFYAKLSYPNGSQSDWMEGETGGWWVTQTGTYQIQGKAWVQSIYGGSAYWAYRDAFSFSVVDNYAPANPSNLTVSASDQNTHPVVTWNANSEADLSGYIVYRKRESESWTSIATVTANSYTDGDLLAPNFNTLFTYKVNAFDKNGNYSGYSNEASIYGYKINKTNGAMEWKNLDQLPSEFLLLQNYPNPFNPSTVIKYNLPRDGFVTLKVFDILGKEVVTLVNENKQAGYYNAAFNASDIPSGIYFYQLQTDKYTSVKKMLLMK